MNDSPLVLDGAPLSFSDVLDVAWSRRTAVLAPSSEERIRTARALVDSRIAAGDTMYGINTGFGSLSHVRIDPESIRELQQNLIRSHAAGVGDPLPNEIVRAMMVILAASLARGHSGIRLETVRLLLELLARGIIPEVPSRGSVGASGDLAPLAHVALALMGEGRVNFLGVPRPAAHAFVATGLDPVQLDAKEGLALINGTHLMCASATLALDAAHRVHDAAVVAAAMAIDACRATDAFLDDRLHEARRQPAPRRVAARMRALLAGSEILLDHRVDDPRVQDPYCLRASPQVIGASLETLEFATLAVSRELGGVTDNPLVFPDAVDEPSVVSGGNFHGMPIAIPMDAAKIALAHVAGIAERRVNWLLTASDSENPVTAYLSPRPGLHSGMMIAQYTAAACCNELQVLAHPASVHNVTTSAGIEDYNSFGATSALHLRQAVERCREVIAIEFLSMAEALEYQRPLRSGPLVERAYDVVRTAVTRLEADRSPAPGIAAIADLIARGAFAPEALGADTDDPAA